MKVLTLSEGLFKESCRKLQDLSQSFNPDLILGIANGGVHVAENMFPEIAHYSVNLKRPSSNTKNKFPQIFSLINKLPLQLLNVLRIIEAKILLLQPRHEKTITLEPYIKDYIAGAQRILIIDDAVDSGVTLKSIYNAVNNVKGKTSQVKTGAITVTTKHPVIFPDYYLYNNRTLIRFPWSMDLKTKS